MNKIYVLVEGHGEVQAMQNLLTRLANHLLIHNIIWDYPKRWINLHVWEAPRGGIKRAVNLYRNDANVGGLLIIRDEDDKCPKELAPFIASKILKEELPFPVAYVLLNPEYEVLFLPSLEKMPTVFNDGRSGLKENTKWPYKSWEAKRGIKEWLSNNFKGNKSYKPTLDQLPMTRSIDFEILDKSGLACYDTLKRAIVYLSKNMEIPKKVYPKVINGCS